MEKPLKTEEQYKTDIYNIYSTYREEQFSDRRQVYFGQLCDFVFRWCTDYLFSKVIKNGEEPEANEMGVEIVEALGRMVKEGNKTPKEENDFFKYLITTLYNVKAEYYRKKKSSIIKHPRTVYDMEKMILSQESNIGRTLTEEEKIDFISRWFNKPEDKVRKYLEMIENKNVSSLTSFEDGDEIYPDLKNEPPESAFFSKIDKGNIREAVESVLLSKQERTRECFRALFTAYCINNSIDFEGTASVLNMEILEKHRKDGKKPEQYEIYQKYHPETKKDSAGVRASEMLKIFLKDLQTVLKEKI